MRRRFTFGKVLLDLALVLFLARASGAYSVLTHEQIVDLLWDHQIRPMLKARFPDLSEQDVKQAHAYAYGGALVQDMGYYPFGNKYFSDLTHYVRTGDFVVALIQEAQTPNEYAFALGALAHYASDNCGHPAINAAVGMEFPSLKKKYGNVVTYEDSPKSHIRAEFGFDMTEVAKNHYTSDSFHDFIGFEISKELLERVFPKVYGIQFQDVIHNEDLAIGTFRRSVSRVIPEMTRVALLNRRQEIVKDTPSAAKKKYLYYLSRSKYEREWGTEYRHPRLGARILAFFLRIVPKVGPFSALNFKIPPPKAEDLFVKSVDDTVREYGGLLSEARAGTLNLSDKDFDTGHETKAGEYALADKTYATLLSNVSDRDFKMVTPELRENILSYYANLNAPLATKRKPKEWAKLQSDLDRLKAAPAQATPQPAPAGLSGGDGSR
ncbi:MAG: zinc dependent phospholipase C family protein [Candidatus Sulfotelmatobacter sp.]